MPTERAKQEAADRANASATHLGGIIHWKPSDCLANSTMSALAEALDELYAIKADMAEIDRIAVVNSWQQRGHNQSPIARVATIAARYREADPLLIEAREICAKVHAEWLPGDAADARARYFDGTYDGDDEVQYALAALKRGIAQGKAS